MIIQCVTKTLATVAAPRVTTHRVVGLFAGALFFISASTLAQQQQDRQKTVQKVVPTMRVVDRDWEYFKSINCNDIHTLVSHNRSEEVLLAKRKSQCVEKFRAFLPAPVKQ